MRINTSDRAVLGGMHPLPWHAAVRRPIAAPHSSRERAPFITSWHETPTDGGEVSLNFEGKIVRLREGVNVPTKSS